MLDRRVWIPALAILAFLQGCDQLAEQIPTAKPAAPYVPSVEETVPTEPPGGCACVGLPDDVLKNDTTLKGFPPTYGATCYDHDREANADCQVPNRPTWCMSKWCYVSPECPLEDKVQTFYFSTSSELYYSYENCGAEDTFSSSLCLTAESSRDACAMMALSCAFDPEVGPRGTCVNKCPCIGMPTELMDNTSALQGYPPTYGAVCGAHDKGVGVCKDSKPPKWCEQSWCYVDPECHINGLQQTFYFPGHEMTYSYANCGAEDLFTAEACGTDKGAVDSWLLEYEFRDDSAYMGTPTDSQECNRKPQCAWSTGKCVPRCTCVSLPEHVRNNETKLKGYSPSYGATCAPHDLSYDYCAGPGAPNWCELNWCYVKRGCALEDKTQSFYFPGEDSIFFSYSNCGAKDEFSSSQCGDQMDEDSCESLSQCDWFTPDFDNDGDGKNDCVLEPLEDGTFGPDGCEAPHCDKKKKKNSNSRRLLLLP